MSKTLSNQTEINSTHLVTISKARKAITGSLMVSEFFEKQHNNVLRDIEELQKKCPLNFELANYKDKQGKPRPMYEMDRTGFTLLAMGFTGEKALDFKIRYIQAFDAMEEELTKQREGGPKRIEAGPTRVCGACGNEKPITEFYRNRSTRDGYAWECKSCSKILKNKHFAANIARNMVVYHAQNVKFCPVCSIEKPATEFYIDTDRPDGRAYCCKLCSHGRMKPAGATNEHIGNDAFAAFKKNAMDLIDHYKMILADHRQELAGLRQELSDLRIENKSLVLSMRR